MFLVISLDSAERCDNSGQQSKTSSSEDCAFQWIFHDEIVSTEDGLGSSFDKPTDCYPWASVRLFVGVGSVGGNEYSDCGQ